MRLVLLHLDDALIGQEELCGRAGAQAVDCRGLGPALRLWSRPPALDRLAGRLAAELPAGEGPALVMAGSGDFHHVTPLLLGRAMEAAGGGPVTVLHFDNHPDWVRFGPGMHCGSWVGRAARLPGVARVITVGVCSPDIDRPRGKGADLELVSERLVELYAWRAPHGATAVRLCGREWPTIEAMGEAAFTAFLPGRIETEAVYVTIDKDVLRPADAVTNWDQGQASLGFVAEALRAVAASHRIIGADVVGDWSRPVYGGGPVSALRKQGEALLDQPWRRPAAGLADRVNTAINLALVDLFEELAP